MKRWLTVLTVLLLLLTGCAEEVPQETPTSTTAATTVPTEPDPGLYDPNHPITQQTDGAIAAYPLDKADYILVPMGEKLLLKDFDRDARTMQLTLLSGETCVKVSEALVHNVEWSNHLWVAENKLAYYDSSANTIVMLDARLREVERIPLPKEEITSLQLNAELTIAYYTAEDRVCAFDLLNGISRLVRCIDGRTPELFGTNTDGMLRCWYWTQTQDITYELFSSQDGRSYYSGPEKEQLDMVGETWFLRRTDGPVQQVIYNDGTQIREFRPAAPETFQRWEELEDGMLVTIHEKEYGILILELYDLGEGKRVASVTLKGTGYAGCFTGDREAIWFVARDDSKGSDVLCCWKPANSPADPAECFFPYYSKENPDTQGLAECAAYAQTIGDTYGITVTLGLPDALKVDYTAQEEYQVSAIWDALEELEYVLSQFNENYYKRVFRVTESRSFTVSLVRSITAANGEPLPDGNGLQVWVGGDPYIVVPVGAETRSQLYHQLWHMTETYVLSRNSILDTWSRLNPEKFSYFESYAIDEDQVVASYLNGPLCAFIDSYSMTYPREDRARIMEYAMQAGNEDYFESDTMQAKLSSLCQSIRKAFKWEESEETFPWEQYLKEPVKE